MQKILYGKSKNGKVKQWLARVDGSSVYIQYGYIDGKQQTTIVKAKPKNVGKKNATTAEDQAVKEFEALVKAQIDKEKYRETIAELDDIGISPMLAKAYEEGKTTYPCFIQPKLNGVRCLVTRKSEDEFEFLSRKHKRYDTLEHLIPELRQIMEVGETFDGEVYIHGRAFQKIASWVKKVQPESKKLQYWIYDVVDTAKTGLERCVLLRDRFNDKEFMGITRLTTIRISSHEELKRHHDKFVQRGFEGAIIRNPNAVYEFFRTGNLRKYKEFKDAEFEIVGYTKGSGLHEGCIIFTCQGQTKKKKKFTFNVTPKFSLEERRKMYEDGESFIGKELTVRYQELSQDEVPIFPVGIVIRDYE